MATGFKIWKYPLPITDRISLLMPYGSRPLSVAFGDNSLWVWVAVPDNWGTGDKVLNCDFRVAGTGHPVEEGYSVFIGTVLDPRGFVWHVMCKPHAAMAVTGLNPA